MTLSRFPNPNTAISLEDLPVDSEIRELYPKSIYTNHDSVRLPFGKTGYHLFGPVDGVKVVLVHGISTPSIIWHRIAPFLADHGLRVLVYDLFGRGYSEAPGHEIQYTPDLYITQLSLIMHHIGFTNAHIVGLSMGGGIVAAFAATFPHLVTQKLIFIASAGLMDPVSKLSNRPTRKAEPASLTEKLRTLQSETLPGFQHAITSSLLHGPISGMDKAFEMIAQTAHIKALIIHGTTDNVVDFRFGRAIHEILGQKSEFFALQDADHDLVVAEPYYEQVRTKILDFLMQSDH